MVIFEKKERAGAVGSRVDTRPQEIGRTVWSRPAGEFNEQWSRTIAASCIASYHGE
jgi:hypothetical protein